MREPEFLPSWYALLLRRRRVVVAQAWATAALAVGLAIWALVGQKEAKVAATNLANTDAQLTQTGVDLQQLNLIETGKRELDRQDQVLRRMGVYVPATRLVSELSALMPPQMGLVELHLQTEETDHPVGDAQRAVDADKGKSSGGRVDRKLKIDLVGMTPTEDELATFLTNLVGVSYFSEVQLVKAEDHQENGHLMRRFEVNFTLGLDDDTAPATAGVSTADASMP